MARFDLLAAIDIRGGRVVRLREGDFARETAYADDPVAAAMDFVERGVGWLHVVDLDGARAGEPASGSVIGTILRAVGTRAAVEVAGGLRTAAAVAAALEAGAARAVVGSAAIADPGSAADLVTTHGPERIAVAIDVRDGMAVGQAWRRGSAGRPFEAVVNALLDSGVRWFEVTAIDRDGSLSGPDIALLRQALDLAPGARIVASGGISSIEDLLAVRAIDCAGAIVGRALYERAFDLEQALSAIST